MHLDWGQASAHVAFLPSSFFIIFSVSITNLSLALMTSDSVFRNAEEDVVDYWCWSGGESLIWIVVEGRTEGSRTAGRPTQVFDIGPNERNTLIIYMSLVKHTIEKNGVFFDWELMTTQTKKTLKSTAVPVASAKRIKIYQPLFYIYICCGWFELCVSLHSWVNSPGGAARWTECSDLLERQTQRWHHNNKYFSINDDDDDDDDVYVCYM